MLVGRITKEEAKRVVWSCDSDKSPGLDGYNFGFIKFCWEEMKENILRVFHNFEEDGKWPRGSNASFIS